MKKKSSADINHPPRVIRSQILRCVCGETLHRNGGSSIDAFGQKKTYCRCPKCGRATILLET